MRSDKRKDTHNHRQLSGLFNRSSPPLIIAIVFPLFLVLLNLAAIYLFLTDVALILEFLFHDLCAFGVHSVEAGELD